MNERLTAEMSGILVPSLAACNRVNFCVALRSGRTYRVREVKESRRALLSPIRGTIINRGINAFCSIHLE